MKLIPLSKRELIGREMQVQEARIGATDAQNSVKQAVNDLSLNYTKEDGGAISKKGIMMQINRLVKRMMGGRGYDELEVEELLMVESILLNLRSRIITGQKHHQPYTELKQSLWATIPAVLSHV